MDITSISAAGDSVVEQIMVKKKEVQEENGQAAFRLIEAANMQPTVKTNIPESTYSTYA